MILRLLKGRGMVSGLFEKKRDAIPPHPAPPQALGMFMIYLHTTFQTPGSNDPLAIAIKPKAKFRLHAAAICCFTSYKKL
jgi:hypothetical protein